VGRGVDETPTSDGKGALMVSRNLAGKRQRHSASKETGWRMRGLGRDKGEGGEGESTKHRLVQACDGETVYEHEGNRPAGED